MTKAELIERIARSRNLPPDITKKDIAVILGITFEELSAYFAKAKVTRTSAPRFTFPRFGTFTKKKRPARRGVNPRTLEPMQIDASCTVDFKASKELRDQMNGAVVKTAKTAKTAKPGGTGKSGKSAASKTRSKATKTRPAAKSKKRAAKVAAAKVSGAKPSQVAPSGRRLTPRDEDAELDALIDDDSLFAELPASRLKRVRPRKPGADGSSETG